MQSGMDANVLVLKLVNDEDLFECLDRAAWEHNIRSGIILGGLGMLKDFELGYYDPEGYKTQNFAEPHELVSMTGSIAIDKDNPEKLLPHIHVNMGNRSHQVFGGHLIKGTVNVVNEIFILKLENLMLNRVKNPTTGLMELNVEV
jgi:predicted DNA-binding protein with PD1-like motif